MVLRRWVTWAALGAVLAGCAEDEGAGRPDAGDTAGDTVGDTGDTAGDTVGDTGDTAGDTGGETIDDVDGTDADTLDGVDGSGDTQGPGGTLAGTALEGIEVAWADDLHLCSGWREGATLAEERANKVEIRLPRQARPSLDEAALRAARLDGVVVLRGPDAAERFAPRAEATTVTMWRLSPSGGGHALSAEVSHDLGEAGVIREVIGVGRAQGDGRPLEVTPESWELRFYYDAPGGDDQAAPLVRCGGDAGLEDAVSVVVGEGDDGWAAWLRYWKTNEGVAAGSYPVWLVAHRLVMSDAPWRSFDVRGHWAQTYVAQHHNWDDRTEVDFRRDLGVWHTKLRAPEEGSDEVVRVGVEGLLAFGEPGRVTVERLDPKAPGQTRSSIFEVSDPRRFPRVDANHLGRELALECASGRVLAAGGADHLVQMLLCSQDGEERLVGIVPVLWGSDLSLIGTRVHTVTSTRDGWLVEVGAVTMEIIPHADDAFEAHVRDAQGTELMGSWGEAEVLGPPELREETLRASGTDAAGGEVSFTLVRRWAGLGVGKSQLYAPVLFRVTAAGRTWEVESWDRLTYTNTHHNWQDELVAVGEDGAELRWRTAFMDGIANELSVKAADGTVLLAPTSLR